MRRPRSNEERPPTERCRWKNEAQRLEASFYAHFAGGALKDWFKQTYRDGKLEFAVNVGLFVPGTTERQFVDVVLISKGKDKRCSRCRQTVQGSGEIARIAIYNMMLGSRRHTEEEVRGELAKVRDLAKRLDVPEYGVFYTGLRVPLWLVKRLNRSGHLRVVGV